MKKILLCVILSTLFTGWLIPAQAQSNRNQSRKPSPVSGKLAGPNRAHIGVLARSFGDSIIVRWTTDNSVIWKSAVLAGGYQLTRISIDPAGKSKFDYRIPVKPWTVDEWKQRVNPRDTLAGVCVQLLYGKNNPIKDAEGVTLDKVVQQKNQNDLRLMLASVLADENPRHAQGMAMGYVDKNVRKGIRYLYIVNTLPNTSSVQADTGRIVVLNNGPEPRPTMIRLQAESGDRAAKIYWYRTEGEQLFTAYYIEKSTDNGRTFRRINSRPWLQTSDESRNMIISYVDSLTQNYRSFQYRVIGLTPFGELSNPSNAVLVQGIDRTPPAAVINVNATHLGKSQVRLTWQQLKPSPDLSGYLIAKAAQSEGPFIPLTKQILPASQRTFLDTTAVPTIPAYYVVVAVDTAKNGRPSLPAYCFFKDREGPAKPKGLDGYIDTTGFVRIVWAANRDPDLLGYRVLFANDPTHVFTTVTPDYLNVSVFNDTTNLVTLTKHLYYRVVAFDKSYNPSEPSDILTLTRPDRVRPIAPVITNYTAGDSTISINWTLSSSDDVAEQRLLRRGASTERWQEIAKLPMQQNSYADLTVKPQKAYEYALIAIDSAGLRSPESFPLNTSTLRILPRPVQQLTAQLATDGKTITLLWKHPSEYARFVIYRASNPNPLRSYDAVNRELMFTDKAIQKGQYEYAVKVIYQDGRESGLSNRVKIEVK